MRELRSKNKGYYFAVERAHQVKTALGASQELYSMCETLKKHNDDLLQLEDQITRSESAFPAAPAVFRGVSLGPIHCAIAGRFGQRVLYS